MKWRECVGLVLQALAEKGYREAPASRQPGDGGTEFLLVKGDERCLLSYKHGTAYRLGEANVRDFANAVQLAGANSGILVTLGTAEGFARDIARRYDVELIDGRSLWPQVEPFAPPAMVTSIRTQAAGHIRRGQRIGLAASLGFGVIVFLAGYLLQPAAPESEVAARPAAEPATPAPAIVADAPSASEIAAKADAAAAELAADPSALPALPEDTGPQFADPATRDANSALRKLEQVARLTDEQRNQRRQAAAARVADLPQADTAVWSTMSTLTIRMNSTDGVDNTLVAEACAILADFEEFRYSRLQLDPPAADVGTTPVRWRVCQ
jgi:hypothetical protein